MTNINSLLTKFASAKIEIGKSEQLMDLARKYAEYYPVRQGGNVPPQPDWPVWQGGKVPQRGKVPQNNNQLKAPQPQVGQLEATEIPIYSLTSQNLLPFGLPSGNQEGFNLGEVAASGGLGYLLQKGYTGFAPGGIYRAGSYNGDGTSLANLNPGPALRLMSRYLKGGVPIISVIPHEIVPQDNYLNNKTIKPPITIGDKLKNFSSMPPDAKANLLLSGSDTGKIPEGLPGGGGDTLLNRASPWSPGAKVVKPFTFDLRHPLSSTSYIARDMFSSSRMPSPGINPRSFWGFTRTMLPSRLGGVRGGGRGTMLGLAAPLAYNAFLANKPQNFGYLSSMTVAPKDSK